MIENREYKRSHVLADRAYGSKEIRSYSISQQAAYVILPRINAKKPWDIDWWLYKDRHLVECFFHKIKQFRRIPTRYDKLAASFLTFLYIASIAILLK